MNNNMVKLNLHDDELSEIFRKAAQDFHIDFEPGDWESMNNKLKQMEKADQISRGAMGDKFIDLANEFTRTEPKERVGAAFMFAAARYNAFEAFSKSANLTRDKEDAINWYTREYKRMLEANMDDLLQASAQ